jgi:tripartite-type tricarboxylate transporter receptor subunit TctC
MTRPVRTLFACFVLPALVPCALLPAAAQTWPARPVKIIAPATAGGTADTLGRLAAQKLSESLMQQFLVENRLGAAGVTGTHAVATSAPDGYTLGVSGGAFHAIAPALSRVPYDPIRDFTHIALFGGQPGVFAINPSLPAKDLNEFIALARARPGTVSYGTAGNGSQGHLVAELLKQLAGIDVQHIPYKGASSAVADMIAGHISSVSTTLATASGQMKAGKARALALTAASRLPDYPDVPTFKEQGYPDLVATTWFGLSGPAGLPADIAARLNTEVRRAMHAPDVRERMRPEGIEPGDFDAPGYAAFVAAELRRWTPVVKASGAKAD